MQHVFIRPPAVATATVLALALTHFAGSAAAATAPVSNVQVSLAAAANVDGIFANGVLPTNGGLDTHDYALSANLLGGSITWSGVTFAMGAAGVPDAVSSTTIALPAGNYTTLKLLALGANGNQPNQTFLITYTDGTTSTVTQNMSDWWSPQNYAGESTALSMAYCVTSSGAQCPGPQALYGYSFAVNVAKTVKSLTLPANRNVVVLDAVLTGPAASSVSFAGSANVNALANDGTAPTNGGLIGSGNAISKNLAGASIAWSGNTFTIGAAGVADAVSSTTLALPAGNFTALKLVAVGARGNQVNQPFVVTYTDGSTTTITQSISDWWGSSGNAGETTVLNMAYCVTSSGGKCSGATALYGYSFATDGTKIIKSLTLPNNRDVVVLSAVLVGTTAPSAANAALAFGAADYSVAQNAQTAAVTVNRAGGSSAAVSVQYATVDGSGVAGSLYTATAGTLQWAANDTSAKTISVPVSNAAPFSGSESFHIALSNPSSGATLSGSTSATVTVVGDAVASSVQLVATGYTVAENAGSMTVSVTRSGGGSGAVSVAYATAAGTAVAGTNYGGTGGTLNWANADTSTKAFTIAITNAPSMSGNANFTVNLSAPGGGATVGSNSTATVTITPVAQGGGSGGNAGKVLSYLSGLNTGSSRRVLSGQHADIWGSDPNSTTQPMENVTPLVSGTGDSPAILALVLNYATNSGAYNVPVTNTLAAKQWAKGGMVMLSLYDNDPTFSFNSSGQPTAKSIPASAFHSLATPGSAAYVQWHKQLDTYAAALHTLTDSGNVLIFRPFIEINGSWNWYGAENATDFITIWKDMHDYLMITKGVKNVLWLYNVNQDVGGYLSYYPGSAYVDLVGMDLYRADPVNAATNGNMYSQLVSTGKPLIIPEIGLSASGPSNFTQDDMVIINSIRNSLPNVVGFVVFNGGWSIVNQNNASSLMNDPWIINVSNITSGL